MNFGKHRLSYYGITFAFFKVILRSCDLKVMRSYVDDDVINAIPFSLNYVRSTGATSCQNLLIITQLEVGKLEKRRLRGRKQAVISPSAFQEEQFFM